MYALRNACTAGRAERTNTCRRHGPCCIPTASAAITTTATIADGREQIDRSDFADWQHVGSSFIWPRRSGTLATIALAGSFLHPAARSGGGLVQSSSPASVCGKECTDGIRFALTHGAFKTGEYERVVFAVSAMLRVARRLEWAVAEHAIHEPDHPEGEPTGQCARRVRGAHGSSIEQSPLIAERKRIDETRVCAFAQFHIASMIKNRILVVNRTIHLFGRIDKAGDHPAESMPICRPSTHCSRSTFPRLLPFPRARALAMQTATSKAGRGRSIW